MHYEVFSDRINGRLPGLFPLLPTSETVTTITSSPVIGLDTGGHRFFIKNRSVSGLELAELKTLRLLGIPVPEFLTVSPFGDRIATNWSGTPLNEVLSGLPTGDKKDKVQVLSATGSLLRRIHLALYFLPIPTEQLHTSYESSAHIVDTFFYKFFESGERLPLDEYRRHKRSIAENRFGDQDDMHSASLERFYGHFITASPLQHEGLTRLTQTVSQLADNFLSRLEPFVVERNGVSDEGEVNPRLIIEDCNLFYGDFKPENILATRKYNRWNLRVIDPILSRGSKYFDLAKFVSRYLIDNPAQEQRTTLSAFLEGYGETPSGNLRVYGPFTFMNLVVLDRLNSLKSLIRRYNNRSSEYRLITSLESPDFCEQILQQTMRLTEIKDDISFADFFS